MYAHSTFFDAMMVKSHNVVTRVDVYLSGIYQTTLTVTDGNVTVQDQPIRRRCTITMQDPTGSLVPNDLGDLLAPGSTEIKLFRGVSYPVTLAGMTNPEYIPLGMFGISKYRLDDTGESMTVQLSGFDRARKVQRAKLANDYVIAKNTNYIDAIQALLLSRYPAIVFGTVVPTSMTTPIIVLPAGKDPWGECRRLLGNIGYEIFFDPDGLCTIRPVQSLATIPNWNLIEGSSATLLAVTKQMDDENFFNHAVVTGESSQNTVPARAEASDQNPASPTYTGGPMGDVVDFYTGSDIQTNAQAQSVANARLNKALGIPLSVDTVDIVHPALDIEDVVQITRAKSNINDLFVVDKLTIPMISTRAMNLSTRQRLVGVG